MTSRPPHSSDEVDLQSFVDYLFLGKRSDPERLSSLGALMTQQDQRFDQLKQKYQSVLDRIQQTGVRLAHLHVQDNKLFMQGDAPSEEIKNRVWDEIKRVDPTYSDLTCDLKVNSALAPSAPAAGGSGGNTSGNGTKTYTVKAGDSLSKISKQFYGDPNEYMKIFEANRDQLRDPNVIQPGQELKIPGR
jgi:nucleoid-associated protein YgaU